MLHTSRYGRRTRRGVRARAALLGAVVCLSVVALLAAPAGGDVKRPPGDMAYSLQASSWTVGVFSTGLLQEPDFRVPYTHGNSAVVVRPVIRGDAAWYDPGFIVRDAQANPSEKRCEQPTPQERETCAEENRRAQDSARATFRHPFLARCVYPDEPHANVSYPSRFFERRDFSDRGFPKPPPTQQRGPAVLGAVTYGEATCSEDYSVNLRAVNDEFVAGAESAPTLRIAGMRSVTNLSFEGDDRSLGAVTTESVAHGVRLLDKVLTIDKLLVTAEGRSDGSPEGARLSTHTRIVGAKVNDIPVEITRNGVRVHSQSYQTEAQRKQAQDAVNRMLAEHNLRVVALGTEKESIENDGEDVVVSGGGVRIDWLIPKATLPAPVLNLLAAVGVTPPQTTIDTISLQLGHVEMIAHAVYSPVIDGPPSAPIVDPPPTSGTAPNVLGRGLEAAPSYASSYQPPQVEQAVSNPHPTSLGTNQRRASNLVKLPPWAILLLALAAGTVVSSTYLLTQQRLPFAIDDLER